MVVLINANLLLSSDHATLLRNSGAVSRASQDFVSLLRRLDELSKFHRGHLRPSNNAISEDHPGETCANSASLTSFLGIPPVSGNLPDTLWIRWPRRPRMKRGGGRCRETGFPMCTGPRDSGTEIRCVSLAFQLTDEEAGSIREGEILCIRRNGRASHWSIVRIGSCARFRGISGKRLPRRIQL